MAPASPRKPKTPVARKSQKSAEAVADVAVAPAAGDGTPAVSTQIKKKDFLERVTVAVGGRKGNVKDIVEAALKVLGDAIHAGEDLILPPLGRMRVVKPKDGGAKERGAVTVKVRRTAANDAKAAKPGKQPLADTDEDS